jgi:outer membrane murein-binding lipoprotein Lpp
MLIIKLLSAHPVVQAEEEVRDLQKKMQQLENDLDQTQEKLMAANQRLEEKEKALQNVSHTFQTNDFIFFSFFLSFLSYLPDTLTHPNMDIG